MHRLFERIRKNQEGLTLIELIVVVAIIGVLAWLITPRVLDALKNAKINSAESAANEFLAGMERYGSEHAAYPADPGTAAALTGDVQMQTVFGDLNISTSKAGSYFQTGTFLYAVNAATDPADFCAVFRATQANGTNTHVWVGKQGVFWGTGTGVTPATLLPNCGTGHIVPD